MSYASMANLSHKIGLAAIRHCGISRQVLCVLTLRSVKEDSTTFGKIE